MTKPKAFSFPEERKEAKKKQEDYKPNTEGLMHYENGKLVPGGFTSRPESEASVIDEVARVREMLRCPSCHSACTYYRSKSQTQRCRRCGCEF